MDRHKSAIKRNRQRVRRTERNKGLRSALRTSIRKMRETVEGTDVAAAEAQLRETIRELDKAVTKGVLHPNAASRRASRLSKHVHKLKSAGGEATA